MQHDFWKRKNVFVTGGNGFIGSWLVRGLVEAGAKVVVLVRDITEEDPLSLHDLRDKVTVVNGDLLDLPLLGRILNEYDIEYCFHLAAQAIVGVANRSPLSTFETNIRGTWQLLEACRNHRSIKGVIVASSDKAYGVHDRLPYTEEFPLLGLFPYDASKACTDILARSFYVTYKLPVVVTRNANIYGGGDFNLNRIIPGTITSVLKGETPIIRSDGTPIRDYMYIKDAVNAYLTVAEAIGRQDVVGQAFNFGTGSPISVLDLFKKIIRLCGKDVQPKVLNEAAGEIPQQFLSSDKAKKILSWESRYSLDQGLGETIEWYKEHTRP
jgi:CDP-glucose 4,6-dehydratase